MPQFNQYSISDLAYYSGIKAHTIRIWEKRYKLLNPQRSETNIRGYSNDELRKLININTLVQAGWKISKIVELDEQALEREVKSMMLGSLDKNRVDFIINGLMVHMLAYDELKFTQVLESAIEKIGIKSVILSVVYPFLHRIGVLWQVSDISPAQEHFASAVIRRKLLCAIDKLSHVPPSKHNFLLCLPPDEFHELPLLLAQYILLENKIQTIYLGSSVPPDVAVQAVKNAGLSHMFTIFISNSPMDKLKDYLLEIRKAVPQLHIYFSGAPAICKKCALDHQIIHLPSIESFEALVSSLTINPN